MKLSLCAALCVLLMVCTTESASISSILNLIHLTCGNGQCMCCTDATECLCRHNLTEIVKCRTGVRCSSNTLCVPKIKQAVLKFECGCFSNQCDESRQALLESQLPLSDTSAKLFCKDGRRLSALQSSTTKSCIYTFDHKVNNSYPVKEFNTRLAIWTEFIHGSTPKLKNISTSVVRYELDVGQFGILSAKQLVSFYADLPENIINKQTRYIGNPQPFVGNCSKLSCASNERCVELKGERKCLCARPGTCGSATATSISPQTPTSNQPLTTEALTKQQLTTTKMSQSTQATVSSQTTTQAPSITTTTKFPQTVGSTTTYAEISEQAPTDEIPIVPHLPTNNCRGAATFLDGECYHKFDQVFRWNPSYDNLGDKELFQEINRNITSSWKLVYDNIGERNRHATGSILRIHRIVRYEISVSGANWTASDLLKIYKMQNSGGGSGMLVGQPVQYRDVCSSIHVTCGIRAECASLLGNARCVCVGGFDGDPRRECSAFCSGATYNNFTFTRTWNGLFSSSVEMCHEGFPKASVPCHVGSDGRAVFHFQKLVTINCSQTVDRITSGVTIETLTPAVIEELSADLLLLATNASRITSKDVRQISEFVDTVSRAVRQDKTSISSDGFRSLVSLVSQVSGTHGNRATGNIFTRSLAELAVRSNLTENETLIDVETNAILVHVQDSNDSSAVEDLNFRPILRTYGNARHSQPIRVRVPASVARRAWRDGRSKRETDEIPRRAAFIFYKNDSLFETKVDTSYVVSVDVGVDTTLRNLDELVGIEHLGVTAEVGQIPMQGNEFKMLRTSLTCKYWDYSTSSWESDGCCLNSTSNPPQCFCNHLTNFALLVRSEQVPSDVALSIVSDVGLAISIVGMILTAIVIAASPEIRKQRTGKILIHICINLSAAHLLFVTAVSRVKDHVGCMVVAALIQYFFLTSWCWMSVYSYDMYISLVKVFSKYRSRFLQKGTLFSYGIPAIIVGITIAVSVGYFDQTNEKVFCDGTNPFRPSYYLAENLCWIKGYSLYLGFLAPIAVCLLYNCVVFVVVTIELNKHNKEVQSMALRRTTKQSLLLASNMVVVLGITWIFAYLMLVSEDRLYLTVTSWFFAIFCSLQGLGIFLLTTVRRGDMRKVWVDPLLKCINCGNPPSSPQRSSKSTGTSKVQQSSSNNAYQQTSSLG